jgi:hypothetical protein
VLSEQEESKQDTFSGWLQQGAQPDPQPPAPAPAADQTTSAQPDAFPHFESPATGTDWANRPSVEQSPAIRRPEGFAPFEGGLPDWMKTKPLGQKRGQESEPPPSEDLPDWLKNIDSGEPQAAEPDPFEEQAQSQAFAGFGAPESAQTSNAFGSEIPVQAETPDWLKSLGAEESAPIFGSPEVAPRGGTTDQLPGLPGLGETPDWLKNLGTEESGLAAGAEQPAIELPLGDTPDWLKGLGSESPAAAAETAQPATEIPFGDSPDWLSSLGADTPATAQQPVTELPLSGSPDWLSSFGGETPASAAEPAQPATEIPFGDTPDWLKDLGAIPAPDALAPDSAAFGAASAFTPGAAAETPSAAFAPESRQNAFQNESLSKTDLDSLFTEMPDWLTGVATEEPKAPSGSGDSNVIAPGSLPSWVEAMRPVETSGRAGGLSDQSLETRGPLAGLNGVLPAVPFAGPTSKPRAYSIKLMASEEQQSHAALLEEVLGAETVPEPIVTQQNLAAQQMLRLATAVIPLLIIPLMVFAGTRLFPLPASANVPARVQAGLQTMWSIPEGSPVLVVFDYEPAVAGEMETLAGPLLDQMILLKHPRLTFVSTSPSGPVLAENFFVRLERRVGDYTAYGSGLGYVNLGYLPGGLTGVRAFAQNPPSAMPLAMDGSRPWLTPALADVQLLSQFTTIIVLTDSPESGRAWIEQAGPLRGAAPLVVAASAQSGPLLMPYFESGQVTLLFTGLRDSALLEQIDAGRPGVARQYWDAYNLGLLVAVAFILGGSGLSLLAAQRDRRGRA